MLSENQIFDFDPVFQLLNICFECVATLRPGWPNIKFCECIAVEWSSRPEFRQHASRMCCFSVARPTKFDKVVRREICQVTTQGIRSFSQRDGDVGDAQPSYLLALCEVSVVCVCESVNVYS